jgi:hypothetical protein
MGPPVAGIFGTAIALEGNRAVVAGQDAFLVAVDLATGERTIVSDAATGKGPRYQNPCAAAIDGDRALVLATHLDVPHPDMAVFAVDLTSGDRSVLSDEFTGAGPEFHDLEDIALAGGQAFVTCGAGVFAVDLASGDRTIVSNPSTGQGPRFRESLHGIVLDGDRAIVIDSSDSEARVLEVDLATGNRRIVSAEFTGEGPFSKDCEELVLDGDRVLVLSSGTLFAVDLTTGDRTIFSDGTSGGPHFSTDGIALSGDRVLMTATDPDRGTVLAVDLRFGQRVIVAH